MARHLLILRHAKSAWDTDAVSDFERPLAKRGKRDAPAMGAWMHEQGLIPDHIISSPAERAKQTIIGVCRAMDIKKKAIHWDTRIYGADTEGLLEVLSDVPKKAKTTLLVGHNPGIEFLFSYLANTSHSGDSENIAASTFEIGLVKTATLVHLKMAEEWATLTSGCATLVKVKSPRELFPSSS